MTDDSTNESDKAETPGNLERTSNPTDSHPDIVEGWPDADNPGPIRPPPEHISTKEVAEDKLDEFFKKKGAVEILAQLATGPKRFNEIDNALVVSHGTISSRLTEGVKIGVWTEYFSYPEDSSKTKLYALNSDVAYLAEIAIEENIDETIERKRQITNQHADAVASFRDQIETDQ